MSCDFHNNTSTDIYSESRDRQNYQFSNANYVENNNSSKSSPLEVPSIGLYVIMWQMRLISRLFVRKEVKSVPVHKAH